ncbi:DUF1456 family protein [Bacillus sp. HMF5848]|uniref:DUF1456 family protein n=1 Tax=Bacillus sp. HMF5848 TaxID=2495421 RepID=UPI000F7AE824|nr:DUF1456 family protein [Bacillus sp. HMF5848]RSK25857.1 DUF1456 family protein [Bacillus sp. HMF5848]
MENNDILIRVRYALDIKETDMVEIFKLGGTEVTRADVQLLLKKEDDEEQLTCNNLMLESFLDGLIIFKRGRQDPKPGQAELPARSGKQSPNVNNMMLKKIKIALSLTSEDMLDIFENAGIAISKGELGALLRKEGHKNYKECGDKFARNFLKGLAIKYRG